MFENPSGSDKYISNGATPILSPQRPLIIINNNFNLPMRQIVKEGTEMNGFIIHKCEVEPLGFYVQNTRCGGNMCDRQQECLSKCACYQMFNQSGNVMISVEIKVCLPGSSSFNTNFRSKWFLETYILNGNLLAGMRADSFKDYKIEEHFLNAISNIVKYINTKGKFQVVGWAKCGEVLDQGVSQPNNGLHHNASRTMVQLGNLIHHITKIKAMKPSLLNQSYLDGIHFHVMNGFNTLN